jgi:small-conductance mechanosensitive channel
MKDNRKLWIPRSASERRALGREALSSLESRIKPDFRRALGASVVAMVCLGTGDNLGGIRRNDHLKFVVIALTLAFAIFGAGAVRSAGREAFRVTVDRSGPAAASALRLVVSVFGYGLVLLGVLQLANVNLGSLLVGGAVTGVVLGIAAQQSLGNFFAGLVLMFSRPYVPGQRVIVRSGAMGGPFEGTILGAGLLYTTIDTADGPVNMPNSGLLAAAVGPAPDRTPRADEPGINIAVD